ncbi:MAG: oxidoreductase [Hyphomicrobiales bacterium]|nr:oxidoreductase [Hyphomicrobiales bacterium]
MRFAVHYRQAQVVAARDLSPSVRSIEIMPDGGAAHWSPGSHINLLLPIGDTGEVRSYSLVGEPGGAYRICVKRDDLGRGGSRYMHSLKEGARVTVSDPHNLFELDFQRPHYLMVAGGIGITPISSMAKTLARRGADVTMLYAARTADELLFSDELREAMGERVRFFVSQDGARIDPDAAVSALPPGGELYICGPMGLVDAFRRAWRAAGRPQHLFRTETFGSGGAYAPEPFLVRAPHLGIEVVVPADRSMLDVLEEAGVEVMFDCKRGECGLCAVDVVSAEGAIDHRDVFLSEHEKQSNARMCACVSRVAGGAVTIDTGFTPDAPRLT